MSVTCSSPMAAGHKHDDCCKNKNKVCKETSSKKKNNARQEIVSFSEFVAILNHSSRKDLIYSLCGVLPIVTAKRCNHPHLSLAHGLAAGLH